MIDSQNCVMLDTNIHIYLMNDASVYHHDAISRFDEILAMNLAPTLCRTIIHEMARVAYRPIATGVEGNGLGWTRSQVSSFLNTLKPIHHLLDEDFQVDDYWFQLFRDIPNLRARDMGDLQIAATMLRHDVRTILTRDPPVFSQIPGIRVLSLDDPIPADLSGTP